MAGRLQINITDAPPKLGIEEVNLTVKGVEIHLAGNEAVEQEDGEEEPEINDGWQSLTLAGANADGVVTFDLLDYRDGLQLILAEVNLAPGKYTQLRLEVTNVELKLADDTYRDAKLPSNTLKFVHPFEIAELEDTVIVFDFDALKSINVQGNGTYMCKPVIKLTTTHPTLRFDTGVTSDTVSLSGTLATQFTIPTGGEAGTMHTLGLINTVATPALADGNYAFTLQATSEQKTALIDYFTAKGWADPLWLPQIVKEINGTEPFFYLNAAGGVYSLVDNFKLWLGSAYAPYPLTIDDNYPVGTVGTYVYTGTLTGINGGTLPVTVTLVVVRVP
jgi:hypothetical protein